MNSTLYSHVDIPFKIKFWQNKTLASQQLQTFGKENFGEFAVA